MKTTARYEGGFTFQNCTRLGPHLGPCNGWATPKCGGFVSKTERRVEPKDSKERTGWVFGCKDCASERYACFGKHRILHDGTFYGDEDIPPGEKHVGLGERLPALKESNPKDAIGVAKLPLSLVPPATTAYASIAHLNGALKYGKWNWREAGVRASVYLDAIKRHIAKWESGEEFDEEGVPHLGSIIADVGIVLDARAAGKLTDDRPPRAGTTALFDALTPIVKQLQERHKGKAPRHYTIEDSEKAP